jgi:Tfp pilus assembly protein PilO
MGTGHADRLWLIGGAVVAAILVAAGWFLLISPENGRTGTLNDRADAARTQQTTLRHKLADLQRQNDRLADYQAQLDSDHKALPATADLAEFLRGLQSGDNNLGVISGFLAGTPIEVNAAGTKDYAVPVTVTVYGSSAQLAGFLDHLQQVQPRAVLVKSVHMSAATGGTLTGVSKLEVGLQVFVSSASAPSAVTSSGQPN